MGNFIHCSEEIKNSNYNCFLPELVFDYPTEFIIYNIFLQFLNFISKILSCLSSILVTLFSLTKLTFILADQLIIYIWGSDHIKNKNNHIEKINNEMLFFINIKYLLILCIVNFFIIYKIFFKNSLNC